MAKNTNLNISPYFDDFDESKNYNRVLFKPGYPVQARELTTLQSILQNQVEKLGHYFFKEGSVVVPGGTTYDSIYDCVRIDPFHLTLPVSAYTKVLVDNNIKIKGETSGITATVINRLTVSDSIDKFDTLYIKYNSSGTDGVSKTFQDGENLITLSDINYSSTKVEANGTFAKCIESGATKTGSSVSINEGLYYIRGFFVQVPKSTVILDQYTNKPSYKIGLTITEEIINASSVNPDLYDNAKGFANESAPGADRFSVSAKLSKKLLTDPEDKNFVELIRLENGIIRKFDPSTDPKFNLFEDALAKRTFEESGNYYVRPFSIDVRESLNDRINNRGLYFENQLTQNTNTPSDGIYCLQMSAGKAYVNGYRITKDYSSSVDVVKPRTKNEQENKSLPIKVGNVLKVDNVYGEPKLGFTNSTTHAVDLLDRRLVKRSGTSEWIKDTGAVTIGKARVYDWSRLSKNDAAGNVYDYDLRLFDIQAYTKITAGKIFDATTGAANAFVEGQYSGASGYIVTASTSTSVSLQDVKGQFQVNEPLMVNGNNIGVSITAIDDYDVSSVKSVHSNVGVSTFIADTVLNRSKELFDPGWEFQIAAPDGSGISLVNCTAVSDFRGILKVGDIITYTSSGVLIYNRVTEVNAATFKIEGVESVGSIDGTRSGTSTPTGVKVVSCDLEKSVDPGYIIPLENPFVSSVNVKDSSYIIRKQLTATASGGSASFNLDDSGDDNLFFEPFTPNNYVLNLTSAGDSAGTNVNLRESQVTIDTESRLLTVTGLDNEAHTLTATVKRSTLSSKTKNIDRCKSIVIDGSKLTGSGAAGFGDGLSSSSNKYGARVQDKEICLNYPDIHRVLGVFESNDATDPALPSITVDSASASDVFTNNVTVGEQFIGNTSGALARVVSVDNATQLSFVYENQKEFENGETITLKTSGIIADINLISKGDRNITSNYDLDTGSRPEYLDYGRIIRKNGAPEPTRRVRIIFDYYTCTESAGTVQTVNSYNGLDYSREIPSALGVRLSDAIDLRPRVKDNYSAATSPFCFSNRDFTDSTTDNLVANQSVILDYTHYLGRIDRLYLTNEGVFQVKRGEASINPKAPLKTDGAFEIGIINMKPYVLDASKDVRIKMIPHKRYTMKDIGGLENRIKTLEEYTTLSLLETDTKNLAIKDPNTGLDKFKSGFFVDNFRNHSSHNFDGDSKFDIDKIRSECRPRSTERNVSLVFETKTSNLNPLSSDYRFVDDFDSDNITRNGPGLTLKFTEDLFINQPLATRVESLNPFALAEYHGTLELTPSTDYWIDEVVGAPQNIEYGQGTFEAFATILGVEDRENGGMSTGMWNTTEQIWGDREVVDFVDNTETFTETRDRSFRERGNGIRNVTERDTIISRRGQQITTWGQSGTEIESGFNLSSTTETVDLGEKVTSIEVLFNCRSRNIEVVGTRLKPNTKYYVFMENVDVTNFCVPKLLPITMTRGSFSTQDIITTAGAQIQVIGQPDITFRAAQANHKFGPFNSPTTTYDTEPYSNTALTNSYSSTSKIINVDTFDLSDFRRVERLGYVTKGMLLTNEAGTAEATVEELSLMSDNDGNLLFSLHIPDPSNGSNPTFTTGLNTIKVTTSASNASILDPGGSSASTNYLTSGQAAHTVQQTMSITTPQIERASIEQPISRITGTEVENFDGSVVVDTVRIFEGEWFDPLAQSFVVPANEYPDGLFVSSGEVYFKGKDESDVTVQIRELDETGRPSQTIVPFGQTKITPDEASLSDDGSVGTVFTFGTPVYLRPSGRYALTLISPLVGWNTFITRMNETDLISGRLNDKQPSLGSLFRSQNSELWTESQYDDLKFKLNKAKFVTNTPSSVIMYNHDLAKGTIRKENPVTAYSKRQILVVTNTSGSDITGVDFDQGDKITQQPGGTGHTYVGRILATGGPITLGEASNAPISDTGTGLPLTTTQNYSNISFKTLTGYGSGAEGTVKIVASGGVFSSMTVDITTGGSGYRAGDLLVSDKSTPIGDNGTGLQVIVNTIKTTSTHPDVNKIILEDIGVEGTPVNVTSSNLLVPEFVSDNSGQHTKEYTTGTDAAFKVTSVTTDDIRDGYTLKVDHKNHGMHSNTNQVQIDNFVSDLAPVTLSSKIDDDSTTIILSDATNFANFEGAPVSANNIGYIKVGKEIISYTGHNNSTNTLSGITREVDDSLRSNHPQNEFVYKYEFNEVSLRKINKTHEISNLDKTFDSYYIRLTGDDAKKVFNRTSSGGGNEVKVSQNIPFEAITPKLNVITPTGSDITSRIKSTSGTSLSGTEVPFRDIGYENISLNKYNELDSARLVASKINEYTYLNDNKSFALELVLNTNSEHVSPLIDLNTANIILHSNLVDSKVTDYVTDSGINIPGSDPNTAIYETKRIDLDFPSNSIYVQFDGHKEADANFRVFYKLYREDSQDADQHYVPFNSNGLSDKIVNSNNRKNTFSEHKYTAENIPEYNAFMIKVVMTSTSQAQAPRLKNFRAIALRSYNID